MADSSNKNNTSQNSLPKSEEKSSSEELVSSGKNATWVQCKLCHSKVLRPNTAAYTEKEFFVPSMQQKTKLCLENPEGDTLHKYWLVRDMFTFENVGFSKNVDTIKYLTCADCEVGPIGWHDTKDNTRFYIALERVEHIS